MLKTVQISHNHEIVGPTETTGLMSVAVGRVHIQNCLSYKSELRLIVHNYKLLYAFKF